VADIKGAESDLTLNSHRLVKLTFLSAKQAGPGDIVLAQANLSPRSEITKASNQLTVKMSFNAKTTQEDGELFTIQLEYIGQFSYSSALKEDTVTAFANVNAPAILYPMVRAAVSFMTVSAGYPPLTLPVLNFQKIKTEVVSN